MVRRRGSSIYTIACVRASSDPMSAPLSRHSRLVFWLKVTLPVIALAILSTLFLFARRIDFEGSLPYADVDINALAKDPRLSSPEYSGLTKDGAAVRVVAKTARPGAAEGDPMTADDVVAIYETAPGKVISLRADAGQLDTVGNMLHLDGNVVVSTSDGYDLRSDKMQSALGITELVAQGHVDGTAPLGEITAESLKIFGPPGQQQMVFKGGVRLIYTPQTEGSP